MTAQGRCMDPSTLDGLLFLRYKKDLWAVADIAIIMRDFEKEAAAAKRAEADRRAAAAAHAPQFLAQSLTMSQSRSATISRLPAAVAKLYL